MPVRARQRRFRKGLGLAAAGAGALSAGACTWLEPEPGDPPAPHPELVEPVHRVERGETLCSVGGRHGLSASSLRASNGLEIGLGDPLPTGISLRLEGTPATYTVRRGDTLNAIARWSGTELGVLARHNGIGDPDVLLAGQELTIPPGAGSVCAPTPESPPRRSPRVAEMPARSASSPSPSAAQQEGAQAAVAPSEIAEAEALLARAEERYAEADYEACLRDAALASDRLALRAESPETHRLAARAAAISGLAQAGRQRREEAVAAFRSAFALDPDFQLEAHYASPTILPLLEQAREPASVP